MITFNNHKKSPSKYTKYLIIYLVVCLILASFVLGLFIGRSRAVQTNFERQKQEILGKYSDKESLADFQLFWDVWDTVTQKFIHKPLDFQKMVYGAISGMVDSLDDPYTVFMTPEETNNFKEEIAGNFEGIGAEIGIKNDKLTIIAPLADSPAEKAGLKPRDVILKINDEDTSTMTLIEAVSKIRGKAGTEVSLLIEDKGTQKPKEVKITRAKIEVESVKWQIKEVNQKKIALIKLVYFGESTASDLKNISSEVLTSNPYGIILDLRNNSGGFLQSSVEVVGMFVEKKVAALESFSSGKQNEFITSGEAPFKNLPVIVLINQGTASASEIVAGALRIHKNSILIGEKSFGKGTVQELKNFSDGSSLRISIAKWLLPDGTDINGNGLVPDIKVEFSDEDFEANKDPQLDRALEEIAKKIK